MSADEVYLILEGLVYPICGADAGDTICLAPPAHEPPQLHEWARRADLARLQAQVIRGA